MKFERARNDRQKELRITEIVNATACLYEEYDYEEITFALIAKEADFTRSNLYKYFNNKEEVFLELLKSDIKKWAEDIKTNLYGKKISIDEFCSTWIELLDKNKRMTGLFAVLYTFLEKNASLEKLIEFKMTVSNESETIIEVLLNIFPSINREKAINIIFIQLALTTGIYPMINTTDKQKKAIKHINLKIDHNYIKEMYKKAVKIFIEGFIS